MSVFQIWMGIPDEKKKSKKKKRSLFSFRKASSKQEIGLNIYMAV